MGRSKCCAGHRPFGLPEAAGHVVFGGLGASRTGVSAPHQIGGIALGGAFEWAEVSAAPGIARLDCRKPPATWFLVDSAPRGRECPHHTRSEELRWAALLNGPK